MKELAEKDGDGYWHLHVTIVGETQNGWRCEKEEGGPFILPKAKSVVWHDAPSVGAINVYVVVPGWLALNHRQIVGDAEFEANKQAKRR